MKKLFLQKHILILVSIFLVALFIRIYKLHILPFNLHEDEILSGYVGRFILENGVDVYGNKLPLLYFNKFGDYYIVLPFYLSGLGVALFGPNGLGVRFFGALLGALAVFPVYFLSKFAFKNNIIALLSAVAIAIMPWHVVLSRTTVEGLMGSTIFATGVVLLLAYQSKRKVRLMAISIVLFFVSYFFYHPFRVYVPMTLAFFCLLYFDKKNLRNNVLPIVVCLGFSLVTLYIGQTVWGSGRFIQTSIFSPLSGVSIRIQEQIFNEDSIAQARLFSNKPLGYSREFLYQYSRYLSPDVLFVRGGKSPRYFVPEQGLLYVVSAPILLYALYSLIKKYRNYDLKNVWMMLFLLVAAPIPAGLTIIESPNIHRAVFMTIPLAMLMGLGYYHILQIGKYKKVLPIIITLVFFGEFVFFHHQYSAQSDLATSIFRNDGQKKIVEYVERERHKYDRVYMPTDGTFPLYYLFYTNNYDKQYAGKIKFNIRLKNADNVYFIDNGCPSKNNIDIGFERVLVVERHNCDTPNGLKQIESLTEVNHLTPFKIYTN